MSAAYDKRAEMWRTLAVVNDSWHGRAVHSGFESAYDTGHAYAHAIVAGRRSGGVTVSARRVGDGRVEVWCQDFKPSTPDGVVLAAALAAADWATQ